VAEPVTVTGGGTARTLEVPLENTRGELALVVSAPGEVGGAGRGIVIAFGEARLESG
jgi:hypothetical protein